MDLIVVCQLATWLYVADSLDVDAPFLDRQGWEIEVNKMITAYGAPIGPADAKTIVDYLVANYGSGK